MSRFYRRILHIHKRHCIIILFKILKMQVYSLHFNKDADASGIQKDTIMVSMSCLMLLNRLFMPVYIGILFSCLLQPHPFHALPTHLFFHCFFALNHIMASSLRSFLLLAILFFMQNLAEAATCNDCFVHSRAAYYPNSDEQGTERGACGFGSFGATINGGDVSAASNLYRDGVGCGACYQVRCTNSNYCADKGVTIVITDQGSSDNTDFILSRRAFSRMAQTTDAAASLLSLGIVDIEYRRVSCSYPNKNITIKIDENSNYPHYLAFVIWYQQGKSDITAVQLCETQNFACKLLDRSYGAVWTTTSPPSGPLSLRMLFSSEDGDEEWLVPVNNIPQDWKAGETYDIGVQVNI